MFISVGNKPKNGCLNFGIHNGISHLDETMGASMFWMAHPKEDIHFVRTENPKILKKLNIVIDIGGGRYDHHQKGFNKRRSTGEKYASAGIMWEEFGEKAIINIAEEIGVYIDYDIVQKIKEKIDKEYIIPVDLEDNGKKVGNHAFSIVSNVFLTWLDPQDFDSAFMKATTIVFDILKGIIKREIAKVATEPYLQKSFKMVKDAILEIPAQTMQWEEYVVNYNACNNYRIKFVIFPYPRGGWAAQCVPPSLEERFKQLVPFPEEWAGENKDTLPKKSGVNGAILCHIERFFVRAQTKQGIIEMCKIAMAASN